MKILLLILVTAISFVACQSANKKVGAKDLSDEERRSALKDSSSYTTIQWLDSTFRDLGKVKEGALVEVTYRFKNSGKHNLIVSDVSAECGCTTPDWPKEPVAPGKEDMIKAVFKSQNRLGENQKKVFVSANTLPQNSMTLIFRVEVIN